MKHPEVTHREELNGREINEISTVFEDARRSNRIGIDRKVFREHLKALSEQICLIDEGVSRSVCV